VLGLSVDSVPTLASWAESLGGISYPLLSDFYPHGEIAKLYGVLREDGRSERAIFVIDKRGTIRYVDIHDIDEQRTRRRTQRITAPDLFEEHRHAPRRRRIPGVCIECGSGRFAAATPTFNQAERIAACLAGGNYHAVRMFFDNRLGTRGYGLGVRGAEVIELDPLIGFAVLTPGLWRITNFNSK